MVTKINPRAGVRDEVKAFISMQLTQNCEKPEAFG
jgi:hypothetical protein